MTTQSQDDRLPDCLLDPRIYPHPVSGLRVIETHISWVVLTGEFAYKFKKAVKYDFLDFSTLEKRRYFCEEELRLNRRFAPNLYLDVLPLVEQKDEGNTLQFGEGGHVIDYAVKMVQFDPDALLDTLVASGAFDDGICGQIARKMANFHKGLFKAESTSPENCGTFQAISNAALDNFITIQPLLISHDEEQQLGQLESWARHTLGDMAREIRHRHRSGMIRECHGDLHLGNMALIEGKVTFFDCIEFNPVFRFIDVFCELAFVIMDLESRGQFAKANLLLNTYLEYRDDLDGLKLLRFYKVYLALVRAKVSLIKERGQAGIASATAPVFRRYVDLAISYLPQKQMFCAITFGISGTGKTTIARQVAAQGGAIQIRSDVERKRLFDLAPEDRSDKTLSESIYTKEATRRTFQRLESMANTVLSAGFPVIVDATFLSYTSRQPFIALANELGVPFFILHTVASEDVIRERLVQREKQGHDASEAGVDVMLAQTRVVESFSEEELVHVVEISSVRPLKANFVSHLLEKSINEHDSS